MNKLTKIILSLLFFSMFCYSQAYEPTWESLESRPYPKWFKDAKLGIFIHWGLYSVPAWSGKEQYAEWFYRGLLSNDSGRIKFHNRAFGEKFRYEDYINLFRAGLFNADEWADLFYLAGAKYIIMVSKHFDGYTKFTEIPC